MIDPDLTDPKNNDQIPVENDGFSEEDMNNPFIPNKPPRPILTNLLKTLDENDYAQVGDLYVQRYFLHDENKGGEAFSILNTVTKEEKKGIKLSELAKVNSEDDLKTLMLDLP
jgi:hypothetical protein